MMGFTKPARPPIGIGIEGFNSGNEVVDPTDEMSASFYEHFGFVKLPGTDRMALRIG